MTKLKEIMELLKNRELTSIEIASELNIPKSNCSVYLNTLYKNGRIEREKINNKIPYKYKLSMSTKEILKQVLNFMSNKCEVVEEVDESDKNLFEIANERVI